MHNEYEKARMIFLSKSEDRILNTEPLRLPKPACPVCGVCQARLQIDPSRATLEDLVSTVVRDQLGYGEEISLTSGDNMVFDPDFDENLPRKLVDLNIKGDSFVTVVDESDDEPRVNLVLSISEKSLPADSPPVLLATKFEIARKLPAAVEPVEVPTQNGHTKPLVVDGSAKVVDSKRKRAASDDIEELEADVTRKRGKVVEEQAHPKQVVNGNGNCNTNGDGGVVTVDDIGDGSIVIDD